MKTTEEKARERDTGREVNRQAKTDRERVRVEKGKEENKQSESERVRE